MPRDIKIIRDPIHNVITIDTRRDGVLVDLMNTTAFQRLRGIRQLGLSWMVFPGAEHSRFTHALGACHLAGRVLDHLERSHPIAAIDRTTALCAALLHDVGHGPFSHLYESVFSASQSHEEWGVEVLTNPASDIHQVLVAHNPELPKRVADVLRKTYRPLFVVQMVSSQLDVDRFDYLLRDSRMTGAQYGLFDIEWILHSLTLTPIHVEGVEELSLAIDGARGLHSVEQHLLGRHFMYRQVYFHPTCRAADMLARSIFQRLCAIAPPPHMPQALVDAAAGRKPSLADYLELDDFLLLGLFRLWAKVADDPVLRDLCQRLTTRRLFHTLDWSDADEATLEKRFATLRATVQKAGFDPDLFAVMAKARDIPYRDVMAIDDRRKPSEEIWLNTDGGVRRLSEISDVFSTLANRAASHTYACFPGELREKVDQALEGV